MAVTKQQKQEILVELTEKFKKAQSIGFAKSTGLSVAEFSEMRATLRSVDASYNLAKKTLIVKALKDAIGIDVNLSLLEGQIGVVCSYSDAVSGLGKVNDAVKKYKWEKLEWAACIFEGELKNLEETKEIAGMPSRETLLGRLVGSMQSPLSALARFFDAAAKDLEAQGKSTVSQLEGEKTEAPTPIVEEVKVEEIPVVEVESNETPTEEKVS